MRDNATALQAGIECCMLRCRTTLAQCGMPSDCFRVAHTWELSQSSFWLINYPFDSATDAVRRHLQGRARLLAASARFLHTLQAQWCDGRLVCQSKHVRRTSA